MHDDRGGFGQGLYPVVDDDASLVGVVTRSDLRRIDPSANRTVSPDTEGDRQRAPARGVSGRATAARDRAHGDDGLTRFPVVPRDQPDKLVGMISLADFCARGNGASRRNGPGSVCSRSGFPPAATIECCRPTGRQWLALPNRAIGERANRFRGSELACVVLCGQLAQDVGELPMLFAVSGGERSQHVVPGRRDCDVHATVVDG